MRGVVGDGGWDGVWEVFPGRVVWKCSRDGGWLGGWKVQRGRVLGRVFGMEIEKCSRRVSFGGVAGEDGRDVTVFGTNLTVAQWLRDD